jgi:hypothetical protein
MKLIFDKGLATEKSVEVDRVTERPLFNRLSASKSGLVADGVPDLAAFTAEEIQTVEIEAAAESGAEIRLAGEYTRITDVSVTYEDGGRSYHVNIAAEKPAAEE